MFFESEKPSQTNDLFVFPGVVYQSGVLICAVTLIDYEPKTSPV